MALKHIQEKLMEMRKLSANELAKFGLPADALTLTFDDKGGLRPDAMIAIARQVPVTQYRWKLPKNSIAKRERLPGFASS